MKTWLDFDVWLLPFLFFILLMFPMLMPTVELGGDYYGGGVIREWVLNHFFIPVVPYDHNQSVLEWWYQASWLEENLVYFLFLINLYALLLPFIYGLMKLKIVVANWYHLRQFKDKQSIVRRK